MAENSTPIGSAKLTVGTGETFNIKGVFAEQGTITFNSVTQEPQINLQVTVGSSISGKYTYSESGGQTFAVGAGNIVSGKDTGLKSFELRQRAFFIDPYQAAGARDIRRQNSRQSSLYVLAAQDAPPGSGKLYVYIAQL
jgi:hypothetical protein